MIVSNRDSNPQLQRREPVVAAVDPIVDHYLLNSRWRRKLHREPRAGFRVSVAHVIQNIIDAVGSDEVLVRGAEVGMVARELKDVRKWRDGRRRRWGRWR